MSDSWLRSEYHLPAARLDPAASPAGLEGRDKDSAKIHKAAQDFEAVLLGHWLEQAEQSFATVPGQDEDDSDDPGKSDFQAIGMKSLATAITASGGIGLARLIEHELNPENRR